MRWFTSMLLATCISLGIALMLGVLPTLNEKTKQSAYVHKLQDDDEQVFERNLRNDNLVDHIVRLPLKLKIQRVDWSHSIFTVDLKITDGDIDIADIYQDLVELSRFGLDATNNVKQVLVRVFHHEKVDPNHYKMLVALDAHRNQWSTEQYERLMNATISKEQFLRAHFSLHFTKHWEYYVGMMNESG